MSKHSLPCRKSPVQWIGEAGIKRASERIVPQFPEVSAAFLGHLNIQPAAECNYRMGATKGNYESIQEFAEIVDHSTAYKTQGRR